MSAPIAFRSEDTCPAGAVRAAVFSSGDSRVVMVLEPFQPDRRPLSPAHTERNQGAFRLPPFQLFEAAQNQPRAGRAHRVAERDRASIHIETVLRDFAEVPIAAQKFSGELFRF